MLFVAACEQTTEPFWKRWKLESQRSGEVEDALLRTSPKGPCPVRLDELIAVWRNEGLGLSPPRRFLPPPTGAGLSPVD